MTPNPSQQFTKSKWFLPAFCLALGLVFLAACWIGGHPGEGAYSLGVMVVAGLAVLLGGRSETIRGLRGDGRDERFAQIDLRATALAGLAVLVALIVVVMIRLARGEDPGGYGWLLALSGVSYVLAVLLLRWRG
ncbi:MAG TPA: hypothetical protein VF843_16180 [Streptosporangiaceae bacterium]